jgi:hypothetical protein
VGHLEKCHEFSLFQLKTRWKQVTIAPVNSGRTRCTNTSPGLTLTVETPMTKAEQNDTRIVVLAKLLPALAREEDDVAAKAFRLPEDAPERLMLEARERALADQAVAIKQLVLASPVESIGDVAAIAMLLSEYTSRHSDRDDYDAARVIDGALKRIAKFSAQQAGLDLAALGADRYTEGWIPEPREDALAAAD